jgi:hypothetical protein
MYNSRKKRILFAFFYSFHQLFVSQKSVWVFYIKKNPCNKNLYNILDSNLHLKCWEIVSEKKNRRKQQKKNDIKYEKRRQKTVNGTMHSEIVFTNKRFSFRFSFFLIHNFILRMATQAVYWCW